MALEAVEAGDWILSERERSAMTPPHKPDCNPDAPASFAAPPGSAMSSEIAQGCEARAARFREMATSAGNLSSKRFFLKEARQGDAAARWWRNPPNDKVSDPRQ